MQALTQSFGIVRRARAWFTTSPAELRKKPEPEPPQNKVVLIRRRGVVIKRVETSPVT